MLSLSRLDHGVANGDILHLHSNEYHKVKGLDRRSPEQAAILAKCGHTMISGINDRCDLNSLLIDSKKYKVDLRNRYITQRRGTASLKLGTAEKVNMFSASNHVSCEALLLFIWHKVLNVFANGDQTVVLITDERDLPNNSAVVLGAPSFADHAEQRTQTCIEGMHSLEPRHLLSSQSTLNVDDVNMGVFDSHILISSDTARTVPMRHPITASFYLPGRGDVEFHLSYAEELFSQTIVAGFHDVLETLFTQVMTCPSMRVADLEFITNEQGQKLDQWNFTDGEYDRSARLNQLFERAAFHTPSSTAVVYKERSLSFEQLNVEANRLAHCLRQQVGVEPEQVIALFLDKSEYMIATVIAIWKSGACYSPIDPSYPDARVAFNLEDTGAKLVLTNHWHAQRLRLVSAHLNGVTILELEPLLEKLRAEVAHPTSNPDFDLRSDQLAYITYTSGTTGVPKGIKKRHTNVVNSITDLADRYGVKYGREAVVLFSPYVFEPFARQTLIALLNSHTLVVVDDDEKLDPIAFPALIRKHRVTYLNGTASVLQEYDYGDCPDLKRLVLVGEDLTHTRYQALRKKFKNRIINEYGFTESAFVTAIKIFEPHDRRLNRSLGRPLRNVKCYVLGHNLKQMPIGAIGELFIGGQGVSEGYLNRPELTKERFLPNPFQTPEERARGANSIIYRTGDLARWIPDSQEVEYLGRNDFQIKLRGIRIEPGEIESVLATHTGIDQSVVVAKAASHHQEQNTLCSQHLVGYWTGDRSLKECDLLAFLETKLPRYMVPMRLIFVQRMPTTINGKVDFRALPEVEVVQEHTAKHPRNASEKELRHIWSKLLRLPEEIIGIDDNFFRLGGNSITCIQMVGHVRRHMHAHLTVEQVFAEKTIERLAARITHRTSQAPRPPPSVPVAYSSIAPGTIGATSEIDGIYVANSLQQGFMYNYLKRGQDDDAYTMQYVCNYRIAIDLDCYHAAWLQAQQRYCSLRLHFVADTEVYQLIDRQQQLDFRYHDVTHLDSADSRQDAFTRLQEADSSEQYRLDRGPLFRVYLVRCDMSLFHLLFSCHHAILDGWSIPILLDFVHESYILQRQGSSLSTPIDDAYPGSQKLISLLHRQNLPYWREQVESITERCDLRGLINERIRYKVNLRSYDCIHVPKEKCINVGGTWKSSLQRMCADQAIMLHSVLQFVFHKVLNVYGNGRHSVVGTIVSGRNLPIDDVDTAVGLFINTLPLIVDHEAQHHKSVLDAIRDIQKSAIAMNMRSSVELGRLFPGEMMHELFDCLLVLENYPVLDKAKRERLHRELIFDTRGTSEKLTYPLALVCVETENGDVLVTLRYASELFDDDTIDDVLDVFQLVFEQLPEKMHEPVTTLEFLGQRQIARLTQWNSSNIDYPQLPLDAIFEQMAADNAEKTAVVYEDAQLTYAELNAAANRVARLLQASIQAQPDLVVALLLEKNIAMFIVILAVWKAGMAYTPIDPSFPRDRIRYILEDTAAVAVLTNRSQSAKVHGVSSYQPIILHVENALQEAERLSDANLRRIACNTDLAYIYFTSGTTGKPKGVMIEHRGVVNLQRSLCKLFQLRERPDEVLLSFSNYTFDHFVEQMTNALLNGQTLLVLNDEMRADRDRLSRYITKYHVTYLSGTPSVISMYDYEHFPRLRRIDCVGEDFSKSVFTNIRRSFDGLIINGYGPTEVSITTHKRLYWPGERRSNKSIGFQIDNSRTYVLNKDMKRVPVGAVGELYLGGDGVGRGYLNRPELTDQRFPRNPYQTDEDRTHNRNHRLYKTGDLVRWLPNEEVEYLGRDDLQIKLRGQRVELGEIEAALTSCASIIRSVVLPLTRHIEGSNIEQKFLAGYFVANQVLMESNVKADLRDKLPEHLIPNRLVQVSSLPVTVSGKLDTKSLPKIDYATSNAYIAPHGDTETRLCHIWGRLLGIPVTAVSVNEDFFSLGGDSLLSMKLSFVMTKHFDRSVTVAHLFKYRTVRALAYFILHEATGASLSCEALDPGLPAPASLAQERLLFIDHFLGGSSAYNVPKYLRLPATTCRQTLRGALASLVTRHEALRTILLSDPSTKRTVQKVLAPELAFETMSLMDVDLKTSQELDAILDSEARHVFDLNCETAIRIVVACVASSDALVLAFNIHHTAFDAWSWNILLRDLSTLYQHHLSPKSSHGLPEVEISYAAYTTWQRHQLSGEHGQTLQTYWTKTLDGYCSLNMPTDFPRPSSFDYDGRDFELTLTSDIVRGVHTAAKTLQTSTFSVFTSAYVLLLSAYANQKDVVIGLPMANRHHPEVENVVGCFMNMVALRVQVDPAAELCDFVRGVNSRVEEGQLNEDFPFERLVRSMHVEYSPDRHPIFQHVFSSDIISALPEPAATDKAVWPWHEYRPVKGIYSSSKFDLSTTVAQRDGETVINFNWPSALFDERSIVGFAATYLRILAQLIEPNGAQRKIQALSLADASTPAAAITYPAVPDVRATKSLASLFEHYALLKSGSPAIVCGDERLTYEQLHIQSNRVANYLRTAGLHAGQYLGLILEPSIDMIVCILAAWKMGVAYVPLAASSTPVSRIMHILKDASIQLVISQSQHAAVLQAASQAPVILLDEDRVRAQLSQAPSSFAADDVTSSVIAYCIYTSGTTGVPKGVLVPQKGVIRLACDLRSRYFGDNSNGTEAVLMTSSFVFDFSIEQFALSFLSGNKLILLPDGVKGDEDFYAYLNRESLTYLSGTPSILSRFELSRLAHLRMVTSAGEQLQPSQFVRMRKAFRGPINNAYGTTETTVYNLVQRFDADDLFVNSLGTPIAGHQVYVASESLQLLPPGALGELFITGDGVTAGYFHQPDLTRGRFMVNPFIHPYDYASHGVIYKTGDAVRRLPNGVLEFRGRNDHQVKMRGFRIELGEVQASLATYPGINACVVMAKSRQDVVSGHADFLVGYYTYENGALHEDEIKAYLSERLPSALIPAFFVPVPGHLPTTIHGKLETRLLPGFEKPRTSDCTSPRNKTEAQLCIIWSDMLGTEVGIHDDFFHMGGDSIMSLQLVARMAEEARLQVTVKDIFEQRTIAGISDRVPCGSAITPATVHAEHGRLVGPLNMLSIQQWFFAKRLACPSHWNQCFVIHTPRLDFRRLRTAYIALQSHHAAFRLSFHVDGGRVLQQYNAESANADIRELHVSATHELPKQLSNMQASLDLSEGRVAAAAYIDVPNASTCTVWLALHHLITDTVSWHIIARDLQNLYEDRTLPAKGSSYRQWTSAMAHYVPMPHEEVYWREVRDQCQRQLLPRDINETTRVSVDVSEVDTMFLARNGPPALDASMQELLLTAFARTIREWNASITAITLEAHGRETLSPGLDISNTVGWFTIMYPFILPYSKDLKLHVEQTTIALKRVPRKGLGYGALHGYDTLPAITFNYLGQISYEDTTSAIWRLESGMQDAWGQARASQDAQANTAILDVTAWIERSTLKLEFASFLGSAATEHLIQAMKCSLSETSQLIQRTISNHHPTPTSQLAAPSDANFVPFFHFFDKPRQGPVLFLLPPGEGGAESYFHNLVSSLNTTRIVAFNNINLHNPQSNTTIEGLARRYITWLQQIQPHGPYHLLGWSFGGVLSLEICLQLLRAGEAVSTLTFIDSYFDVQAASTAIGFPDNDCILDPIYWRYRPTAADLARINDRVGRIVLFKATLINERARDERQKKLFAWYQASAHNGLDAWLPANQIETSAMAGETHFTWVKNSSMVERIAAIIRNGLSNS